MVQGLCVSTEAYTDCDPHYSGATHEVRTSESPHLRNGASGGAGGGAGGAGAGASVAPSDNNNNTTTWPVPSAAIGCPTAPVRNTPILMRLLVYPQPCDQTRVGVGTVQVVSPSSSTHGGTVITARASQEADGGGGPPSSGPARRHTPLPCGLHQLDLT